MWVLVTQFLLLSMAVGAITLTLSRSVAFTGFRKFLTSKSATLGKLINCTFCTSWWVSIGLYVLFHPVVKDGVTSFSPFVGLNPEVFNAILSVTTMVILGSVFCLIPYVCHKNIPISRQETEGEE